MKKSNIILIGLLIVAFFLSFSFQASISSHIAAVSNKLDSSLISEIRNVGSFKKIEVHRGIHVLFKQDSSSQITVEAPETMIAHIKTDIVNDTLIIKKSEQFIGRDSVKILINHHQLHTLVVNPKAYFETVGTVSGERLTLHFKKNSEGSLQLSYESVRCKAASDSKVNIKGNSKEIDFSN